MELGMLCCMGVSGRETNIVSCPVGGKESGLLVSGSVMTLHNSLCWAVYILISAAAAEDFVHIHFGAYQMVACTIDIDECASVINGYSYGKKPCTLIVMWRRLMICLWGAVGSLAIETLCRSCSVHVIDVRRTYKAYKMEYNTCYYRLAEWNLND